MKKPLTTITPQQAALSLLFCFLAFTTFWGDNVYANSCTAPTITCPGNQTANTSVNSCDATVTYSSSPTTTGTAPITITYSFAGATTGSGNGDGSGSLFNKGTTTVTLTATNSCGTETCTFEVVVNDNTPPTITCSGPVTINNTPGLCSGKTTLTAPVASDNCSIFGNAFRFDGVNDLINCPDGVVPTSGEYTVMVWARQLSNAGSFKEIFSQGRNLYLGRDNAGIIRIGDGWNTGIPFPTDNQWHHYAVVRETNNARLYIDGVLMASKGSAIGSPISVSGAPFNLVIGHQWYGSGNFWGAPLYDENFNGIIDELQVWNSARTQAQIQAGMNSEASPQTGLVAVYHFNQGIANGNNSSNPGPAINTLIDDSGNNQTGTLVNTALTGSNSNWTCGVFGGCVTNNYSATSYPIGNTLVTWTATDASGNTNTCTQTVTVISPEIDVQGNGTSIADGDLNPTTNDHTDFGHVVIGNNLVRTFTIKNTGTADLILGPGSITVSGSNASLFVVGGITLPVTMTAGDSTTFTITFSPSSTGIKTATVLIASNDCNESSYDFSVTGNGIQALTSLSITGAPTSPLASAVTFSVSLNRISPPAGPVPGEIVTFTITLPNASTQIGSVTTNSLGLASYSFVSSMAGVHTVVASFAGNFVHAGSVSSVLTHTVLAAEIDVQGNALSIADGDTTPDLADHTHFGNVLIGGNLVRTYTIQNTGVSNLIVSNVTSSNPLFTVGPVTPSGIITPNDSATFSITFSPTATGVHQGTITIYNDDLDEGVYDFAVQGTGTCIAPVFSVCPSNQSANTANGQCTAAVTYTVTASGTPVPTLTYTFTGATTGSGSGTGSGSTFNKGTTTVTLTATNSCDSAACTFTVTVIDNQPPVIMIQNCSGSNASGVAYMDGWQSGDNDGNGFGSWTLNASTGNISQAGFVVGNSTTNGSGIDLNGDNDINTSGKALGLYANSAQAAQAVRSITGSLQTGTMFYFALDNGDVDPGQIIGVQLQNSSGMSLGEIRYRGGQPYYEIVDINGITTFTSIPFTTEGLMIEVTPITLGQVSLKLSRKVDGVNQTLICHSFPGGGNQLINRIMIFNSNAGTGIANMLFVNNFQVCTPVAGCPTSITLPNSSGTCGAVVNFDTPFGNDNCPGAILQQTDGLPSGSVFPVGTTTNKFVVTDASGNQDSCSFTVTITDTTKPTITCPPAITVYVNSACDAALLGVNPTYVLNRTTCYNPSQAAASLVAPPPGNSTGYAQSYNEYTLVTNILAGESYIANASGNNFLTVTQGDPNGPVVATGWGTLYAGGGARWTATVSGNYYVHMKRYDLPCVSSFGQAIFITTLAPGQVNLGSAIIFDNCNAVTVTNDAPSNFPVGNTTVTWTVTDAAGNTNTCTQLVTVIDSQLPTITCPANVTVNNDPGLCSAVVTYTVPVGIDNCSGSPTTQIAGLGSGSAFPVGTTTNTFQVIDASGNSATCSFTVTVNDTDPPVISGCPSSVTIPTDSGLCSAVFNFTNPAIFDNCGVAGSGNQVYVYNGIIETFVVPAGVTSIDITAIGAKGGDSYFGYTGGTGASMSGTFAVTPGQTLKVLVGGEGGNNNYGGGGGGSFVTDANNNPLVIAGGGGGAGISMLDPFPSPTDATTSTQGKDGSSGFFCVDFFVCGFGPGGINGNGGTGGYGGGGSGGGLLSNGVLDGPGQVPGVSGFGFVNGGAGGSAGVSGGNGGFGGGGGGFSSVEYGGGGGGGYSGGGGGSGQGSGGGGASFNAGINQNNIAGAGTGNGSVTISWNVSGATIVQTNGLPSGSAFPLGTTTVTWTATDGSGNSATCTQQITVTDNEAPGISGCPGNQTLNVIPNTCAASYSIPAPTISDNCTGPYTWNYSLSGATNGSQTGLAEGIPSAGILFNKGNTVVTLSSVDASNNVSLTTCTFTVTVVDNEAPSITCLGPVVINNTPGLCTGTASLTPPVVNDNCAPAIGTAIDFNGTPSYATLPAGVYFNGNFTIEAWVYPRAFTNWSRIIDFGNGAGSDNVLLGYTYGTSGKPGLYIGGVQIQSTATLPLNQWSHVSAVLNGNIGTIYVNGVDAGSGPFPVPANVNRSFNYIARSNWGAGDPDASASFDELRIWNVARTASEIQATMNTQLNGNENGLMVYFPFNEGIACGDNTLITQALDMAPAGGTTNATYASMTMNGSCLDNYTTGQVQLNNISNNAPSTFPMGNTTVTWTATDAAGNSATCDQLVTVIDNQAPSLNSPLVLLSEDFEFGALSPGWSATGLWHVTNSCAGGSPVNPSNWAYFGTDANCNFNNGSVSGSLSSPVIAIPASASSATITFWKRYNGEGSPTSAFDLARFRINGVDQTVVINGTSYPTNGLQNGIDNQWQRVTVNANAFIGQNVTLSWFFNSVDNIANGDLGLQIDSIRLVTDVIVLPAIANTCAANFTIQDPISDNCNGSMWGYSTTGATSLTSSGNTIADGSNSGVLSFNKGVTVVTLTGVDAYTNNAIGYTFTVTVVDNEAPGISGCPGNQSLGTAANSCTAGYSIPAPTISDNCTGPYTWNASFSGNVIGNPANVTGIADGSLSPLITFNSGATVVTLHSVDASGNVSTSSCTFTVTVTKTDSSSAVACDSYTWTGTTYTTSGIYVKTLISAAGCDSVHTLNLTVNYSSTGNSPVTICDSYTWTCNNLTYTNSGMYTCTYLNSSNCVHTETLNLTVNYSSTGSSSTTACDSYTWTCNNLTYTNSGMYTCTYLNNSNCVHTETLILTMLPGVYLNVSAWLGGAYDMAQGLMQDSLRVNNLIPVNEPYSPPSVYNINPLSIPGGEAIGAGVLSTTGSGAIVDWILVEVRQASNPMTVLANVRGLIRRDGAITGTDGISALSIPTIIPGYYHVSVKHRNHLGVMTANPVFLSGCTPTSIDFRTTDPVFVKPGVSNPPRKAMGTAMTLWSADANFNKNIRYNGIQNDKETIALVVGLSTLNNTIYGYRREDVNMDGKVRYNGTDNDRIPILQNVGVNTPNSILNQHTPN